MATTSINAEVWATFKDDADRILHSIEEQLLALERDASASGALRHLLRDLHTMKGGAGFLGLDAISRLCHVTEDLLALVVDGAVELDGQTVSLLLSTVDMLRQMVEESADGAVPAHQNLIAPVVQQLQARMKVEEGSLPDFQRLRKVSIEDARDLAMTVEGALLTAIQLVGDGPFTPHTKLYHALAGLQGLSEHLGLESYGELMHAVLHCSEEGIPSVVELMWRLAQREVAAAA
ncbi:MAG: Hpt domain-containing protein, partial [Myxococcota bacterium]